MEAEGRICGVAGRGRADDLIVADDRTRHFPFAAPSFSQVRSIEPNSTFRTLRDEAQSRYNQSSNTPMYLDAALPNYDLQAVPALARQLEQLGYDGLWIATTPATVCRE